MSPRNSITEPSLGQRRLAHAVTDLLTSFRFTSHPLGKMNTAPVNFCGPVTSLLLGAPPAPVMDFLRVRDECDASLSSFLGGFPHPFADGRFPWLCIPSALNGKADFGEIAGRRKPDFPSLPYLTS